MDLHRPYSFVVWRRHNHRHPKQRGRGGTCLGKAALGTNKPAIVDDAARNRQAIRGTESKLKGPTCRSVHRVRLTSKGERDARLSTASRARAFFASGVFTLTAALLHLRTPPIGARRQWLSFPRQWITSITAVTISTYLAVKKFQSSPFRTYIYP